jgi:hypothetical protein
MKNMMERSKCKSNRREGAPGREVTTQQGTGRKPRDPNRVQLASVNRDVPSGTKPGLVKADAKPIRISPGKLLQVQGRLLQGESQRQIARELHVSRSTTTRVIKSQDFQNCITESREKLFGIVPEALESFRAAVRVDGAMAHGFLREMGIVPERDAMLALAQTIPSMTPEEAGRFRQSIMIGAVLLDSEKNYGAYLPEDVKTKLNEMKKFV